ncbi:2360_t:CDS:2 [Paraglomus occultum]|uniref:2360_t:CDS:1 n=1 Tax=Paraglomus occultum TaxID=144539 RepID=A0A9N8WH46_9GLOM|nr:2360_t:CDS:2 [Paraglomus occultum]
MEKLPKHVLELLTVSNLKEVELPPQAQELLDKFEKTYEDLGTDFSLSDMDGIGYPVGIEDPQLKKNMGMIWSVLEGLQKVEDLLKKALQLNTFVDDVACGVKRVLEESMVLPVDENEEEDIATRVENLTIASTPYIYTPQKR